MNGEDYLHYMRERNYPELIRRLTEEGLEVEGSPRQTEYTLRNLEQAHLRIGSLYEAIKCCEELIPTVQWPVADDYLELGAAYWIQGNLAECIANWRKALKCSYGDAAGNLVPALLLYYAAVRTNDSNLLTEAAKSIEKKLKTGWSRNWPAPIGRYLIGQVDETVVQADFDRCVDWTKPDEGCRWDFYRGVKHLERGEHNLFLACMQSAVDRPNQITWTTEFVLARHELKGGVQ